MTNVLGGRRLPVDIEVVDAVHGERITERNVSSGGRRVGHGTYTLSDVPSGGTRVTFTYAWQRAPIEDRLLAPVIRSMMRRALRRALDRLAGELAHPGPVAERTIAGGDAVSVATGPDAAA